VLLEDSAALVWSFCCIHRYLSVSKVLRFPFWTARVQFVIGLVLAVTASLLARETKSLLIGESADPALVDSNRASVGEQ